MDTHPIVKHLERYHPISDEDKAYIEQIAVWHEYPKHELLLRAGSVCNHVYFVVDGLIRNFYYKDGRDVTTWFGINDTFDTILDSILNRRPSRFNIETVEPTRLYAISFSDLKTLYERSHTMERVGRLSTLDNFLFLENRLYALQFYTARERYANFLEMFPGLANRVPLTHIASYLGITLETLSRIRANLINVK